MKKGGKAKVSDLTLEETVRIEVQVQCRLSGRIRDLRILLCDNGLILTGHAPTYHTKQLAQQAVMEASGLPITNEIEVR